MVFILLGIPNQSLLLIVLVTNYLLDGKKPLIQLLASITSTIALVRFKIPNNIVKK